VCVHLSPHTAQVADFRTTIEQEKDVEVHNLIFLGKVLDNEKTFADYGMESNAFVVCVARPRTPRSMPRRGNQ